MAIIRINEVDTSTISKINGIDINTISKINGIPLLIGIIPEGLIIPYTGGAGGAPDGWSLFASGDGGYIVGAGSTYNPGDSGAGDGTLVATTANNLGHTGSTTINTVANSGNKYRNSSSSGIHGHTISIPYVTPYQECYLIKANSGNTAIPQNGVLWTYGDDKSALATNIWTNGYMFKSNPNVGDGGSDSYTPLTSAASGAHAHGISDSGNGSGSAASIFTGNHTHSGLTVAVTNLIRRQAMAAWRNATNDIQISSYGSNIIGMYESITPPDGWFLCDGDNGTPDMRDYFIRNTTQASAGSGSGDGTVTPTTVGTINHGHHSHRDGGEDGGGGGTAWHQDASVFYWPEHAALSDNQSWLPPYYSLAFIMRG